MGEKLKNEELGRLSVEAFRLASKHEVVVVLDNVRSLHNVGSVFRTADSFRIEAVYLCGVTGTPPNKEIEKTALGATASVSWKYFKTTADAISELKDLGYKIYAVEQARNSKYLNDLKFSDNKVAFIFGHEVYGVEENLLPSCEGIIEIPQAGTKHSLNVSVSAGIVLWEFLRNKLQK